MAETNLKHKTKVGLYWSLFEKFANIGMQFVVGIVMARLLSPSDYGITALPAVFIAVSNVLIESGFSQALVRKHELKDEDISTAFYYSMLVGILLYVTLFFLSPWIAIFYDQPVLTKLVRITALLFIITPITTPQMVLLQRRLDFKTPARISVINKIISGIIGILTAYLGFGLWALVISNITASVLGCIQTWLAVRWVPKAKWSKESFQYLWNYGNKLIASNLINTLYANVVPLVLGKVGGTVDLGNLHRAKQYAALPNSTITGTLTSVTFPVLSKVNDDKGLLERNYRKMISVSSYIMFPIMMLIAALARPLIIVLVTEKWEAAIYLLQIMCFTYMWQPIQILNINILQVMGHTDYTLKLEIIKKPIGLIFILVGISISVVGLCYADLAYTFVALFFNTYYTKKLINVGLLKQMKDILPSLLLSLLLFGIVLLLTYVIPNLYLQLIIGVAVGIILYVGLSYLFRFSELNEVFYLLKLKS